MFSDESNCRGTWTLHGAARVLGAVLAGAVLALGLPGCVVDDELDCRFQLGVDHAVKHGSSGMRRPPKL